MQAFFQLAAFVTTIGVASSAVASLSASRQDGRITVSGDHFCITVDAAKGGEIVDIELFDGSQWNQVLGADGQTCPMVTLGDANGDYLLSNDPNAAIADFKATSELVSFLFTGVPRTAEGKAGPWTMKLGYEIYAEGAVFISLDYTLPKGEVELTGASLAFIVDRCVTKAAHYNTEKHISGKFPGFRTARVAFGINPAKSFTNEIEAIVEHRSPPAAEVEYETKEFHYGKTIPYKLRVPVGTDAELDGENGQFTWMLTNRPAALRSPYHYHNRFSLALSAAATGKARSSIIGQRIYTWVNFLDKKNWYPSNELIDRMTANGATMLILHKYWMHIPGSNGIPHADYKPRDDDKMARTINRAHQNGMRVGFYMRGCEMYALDFFTLYGKRNWDGIFMDWHGALAVARHNQIFDPDPAYNDKHFSEDGNYVPAREYFLFAKRCREIVGPDGFLIGHQGISNSGALGNLVFDSYTPGENLRDWDMFSADVEVAAYGGMMGSGVCTPWPIAAPYRSPEGVAKMAVWGFYPHVILAYETYSYKPQVTVLAADPSDEINRWVLPYWRLLAAINVGRAMVYNLPSVNVVAATCLEPGFHCVVYKQDGDTYLVIVGNLGTQAARTEITLVPEILGLTSEYKLDRIDPKTGAVAPHGSCTNALTTSVLPQWGIEGFKLSRKRAGEN